MNHHADLIKLLVTLLSSDICQITENMPTINRTSGQDSRKDQGSNTDGFLRFYSRKWPFTNECDLAPREIDSYLIMASALPLPMLKSQAFPMNMMSYRIFMLNKSAIKAGTSACNNIQETSKWAIATCSLP